MADHDENEASECGPKFSPPLYMQRYQFVRDLLSKESPVIKKLADFGCAEGRFIRYMKQIPFAEEAVCVDIIRTNLEEFCVHEAQPIMWDHMFGRSVPLTVNLYEGSVAELDCRLKGFDAVSCIELIEHLHPNILAKLPLNIFGYLEPRVVVFTTPNSEFNVLFPQLNGKFRHWDHKFEWTRQEFKNWCREIVKDYPNYDFEITGVGNPPSEREDVGFCTQIAIFRRLYSSEKNNDDRQPHSYSLVESFYYRQRTKEEEIKFQKDREASPIDWDACISNNR
ncbi:Small RNA 2'-O-methyltransferase-like protein [Leptotrombidium deliense]|uniref:Small RNA 2'-O-methyltransferase n=1 Tax=Leptotrombidium deliense TaxID=299467 RepID=A0A443S359_9ACAR|nr:Small RNA 2'-O-methyltransferase-like protein [Leptotrombidium deliense]